MSCDRPIRGLNQRFASLQPDLGPQSPRPLGGALGSCFGGALGGSAAALLRDTQTSLETKLPKSYLKSALTLWLEG